MQHSSSDHPVRDLVAQADRRRRARAAGQLARRLAPRGAAVALGLAVVGYLLRWPSWVGVAALLTGAAALATYILAARRLRPPSDAVATAVDADAGLAGELRSAHWFESQSSRDDWAEFHLARAADRARGVDWTVLYPSATGARAWLVTAALAVAVVAFAVRMPTRTAAATVEETLAVEGLGDALPMDLQRRLAALMAELDQAAFEKDANAKQVTLAELQDLMAKLDPALQKKLEELIDQKALGKETANTDAASDERPDRAENATAGLPEDAKWALDNEAARSAQDDARQTNEKNPSANQSGEPGTGSPQAETEMTASPAASPLLRESATDAGGKMMMGGGGPMGGDSRPGAGGNNKDAQGAAEALLVAQALRQELVEANADAIGEHVEKEDLRRKTEQGKSSLGFTRVAPPGTVEPSRAIAPPPVPEARRPLLHQYFIRKR